MYFSNSFQVKAKYHNFLTKTNFMIFLILYS